MVKPMKLCLDAFVSQKKKRVHQRMNKPVDIIIIGAGPAGMMSAIYASRSCKDVLLIDKFTPGGRVKSTYQVDNYLGFGKVDAHELVSKMVNHLHDLGIQETYGCVKEVIKQDHGLFKVVTDMDVYEAKAVIIATGTNPKPLNVENEKRFLARGVSYCAVCDAMFFENEDVVVIGGGDSALEEGLYLSSICRRVTIIHEFEQFNASNSTVKRLLEKNNVICKYRSKVCKFNGSEELTSVDIENQVTKKQETILCSGAFIYAGNQADTKFLSSVLPSSDTEYIEVSQDMKTKTMGLFACGDVTKKDYRFIVTAISDGAIAALSAVKYIDEFMK